MFATLASLLPSNILQLDRGKDAPTDSTEDDEECTSSPTSTRTNDDIRRPSADTSIPSRPTSSSAPTKPCSSPGERRAPRPRRPKPEKPLNEVRTSSTILCYSVALTDSCHLLPP